LSRRGVATFRYEEKGRGALRCYLAEGRLAAPAAATHLAVNNGSRDAARFRYLLPYKTFDNTGMTSSGRASSGGDDLAPRDAPARADQALWKAIDVSTIDCKLLVRPIAGIYDRRDIR